LAPGSAEKRRWLERLAADFYFDLENPQDLARLEQPQLALEDLTGLIVIDEIQRLPDLFPLLRYLVDQGKKSQVRHPWKRLSGFDSPEFGIPGRKDRLSAIGRISSQRYRCRGHQEPVVARGAALRPSWQRRTMRACFGETNT
jgi:hypothetical protein